MNKDLLKKAKQMLISLLDDPSFFEMEDYYFHLKRCGCFAWHLTDKKIISRRGRGYFIGRLRF